MSATLTPVVTTAGASIERAALKHALALTKKVVGARVTLPALSGVMVEVTDGLVTLQATDLEQSITVKVAASDTAPGRFLVHHKTLAGLVANGGERVELLADKTSATVAVELGAVTSVRLMPVDDFPALPEVSGRSAYLVADQVQLLAKLSKAASTDQARPVLTGAWFDDCGTVATTDSYRLATAWFGEQVGAALGGRLVPAHVLRTLGTLKADVLATGDDGQVGFRATVVKGPKRAPIHLDVTITSRLIEGSFPNYQALLPDQVATVVVLDRATLAAALKTLPSLSAANTPVLASFGGGQVTLSIGSQETATGEVTVPLVSQLGEAVDIAFNPGFLATGVEMFASEGDQVAIALRDGLKPAVFSPEGNGVCKYLLMPMRVN